MSKKVTPHTFRNTIATLLLESGLGIGLIQNLLGHSRINITEIYVNVNDRAQRAVLNKKTSQSSFLRTGPPDPPSTIQQLKCAEP